MADPHPWYQYYPDGVPTDIAMPTKPLSQLIEKAAAFNPKGLATGFFGAKMTYEQVNDQVMRAAHGLQQLGVSSGDRVAIILPNCPQHIVAFYAVLRLGAVVVEHNPLYTARELRHMFEDHAAHVAICWDVAVAKLQQQPDDVQPDHIISVNMTKAMPPLKRLALKLPLPPLRQMRRKLTAKAPHTTPWEKLLKTSRLSSDYRQAEPEELAVIQYTSGTTAQPKGAMLTHRNIYANTVQAKHWLIGLREDKETFYAVLPLFHVFGLTLNMTLGVLMRAFVVLFPTVDPALVLAEVRKTPPTVLGAVPPIFAAIATLAKRRHIQLKKTKFCFAGAMKLTDEVNEIWETTGAGPLIEGYGMTETSPVCFGNPLIGERRLGAIGVPFPSVDAKVVNPDDPNQVMRPGERGELLVRGPNVFVGYWNNPQETDRVLLPDGWLRTGDVVTMEADGFTTVVDRVKELIITGGFNVAPTEVEAVLRGHHTIADAAVVGLPDPMRGEMVVAAVVLKPGMELNAEDLRAYAKVRLAAYKVPRRIIAVEELPKSMLGKVLRAQVREMIRPLL